MIENNTIEKNSPVKTDVGIISGRDAIYLKDIVYVNDNEYCIKGQLSGYNCSLIDEDVDLPFSITFTGVLLWRAVELDYAESELCLEYESSFDLVTCSKKLVNMRLLDKAAGIGKIDRGYDRNGKFSDQVWHQHFVLSTYDTVFEIIAQSYDLVIEKSEPTVYVLVEDVLKLKS